MTLGNNYKKMLSIKLHTNTNKETANDLHALDCFKHCASPPGSDILLWGVKRIIVPGPPAV